MKSSLVQCNNTGTVPPMKLSKDGEDFYMIDKYSPLLARDYRTLFGGSMPDFDTVQRYAERLGIYEMTTNSGEMLTHIKDFLKKNGILEPIKIPLTNNDNGNMNLSNNNNGNGNMNLSNNNNGNGNMNKPIAKKPANRKGTKESKLGQIAMKMPGSVNVNVNNVNNNRSGTPNKNYKPSKLGKIGMSIPGSSSNNNNRSASSKNMNTQTNNKPPTQNSSLSNIAKQLEQARKNISG